jgi:hypothetical protein
MTGRNNGLYAREATLGVHEFRRVLEASGLGAICPVSDEPRLQAMLAAADLIVSRAVGAARGTPQYSISPH